MISAPLPSSELLESVKLETGYVNIINLEEGIKLMAADAEKEIGYNTLLVLKKLEYEKDDLNFNGSVIWLPKDCWEFCELMDSDSPVSVSSYHVVGDYLYLQEDTTVSNPVIYYYGLTLDGYGWPLMSRAHKKALTAYIVWKLFLPKSFMSGQRSMRALAKDYEQDWLDSRDAARGNDVMPSNQEEWQAVSDTWGASLSDLKGSCRIRETDYALSVKKECVLRESEKEIEVYHWQYDDLATNIDAAAAITEDFLSDSTTEESLAVMLSGKTIAYNKIARIGFAIKGNKEKDAYDIYDILGQNLTDVVFDKYYNETLDIDIFISKEFYSYSNIFFKLNKK